MTREELIRALNALVGKDREQLHIFAEGMLLRFLSKEGYDDIVKAYLVARERLHFAYA